MRTQNHASTGRLALGAALLLIAATATSCGMALPTQPALDTGATIQRSAATTSMREASGPNEVDDTVIPSGGPDVTSAPPAGEEIVPTPSSVDPGNSTWGHSRRRHNK